MSLFCHVNLTHLSVLLKASVIVMDLEPLHQEDWYFPLKRNVDESFVLEMETQPGSDD